VPSAAATTNASITNAAATTATTKRAVVLLLAAATAAVTELILFFAVVVKEKSLVNFRLRLRPAASTESATKSASPFGHLRRCLTLTVENAPFFNLLSS
jgi:hypothetical protein